MALPGSGPYSHLTPPHRNQVGSDFTFRHPPGQKRKSDPTSFAESEI
jgi:hypothetical protein